MTLAIDVHSRIALHVYIHRTSPLLGNTQRGLPIGHVASSANITVLDDLALMRLLDEQFLETPWYGARQMVRHLRRLGHAVGRKRVRRLMATIGLAAIYQRPRTTVPHP